MALRFASFEADTEAVTWFSGEFSFGRHHVLLAKSIKLRYSASMWDVSFFNTSFEASVSNVTSLHKIMIFKIASYDPFNISVWKTNEPSNLLS